jgi:hypothetical protein
MNSDNAEVLVLTAHNADQIKDKNFIAKGDPYGNCCEHLYWLLALAIYYAVAT